MQGSCPGLRKSSAFALAFLLLCAIALACGALTAACGDARTPTTLGADEAKSVTFQTSDGVTLGGHLFGGGSRGIVLAHMYPSDQTSWYAAAKRLSDEGYLVLTFDFRGHGESEGSRQFEHLDRDVFAAVQYLADSGATKVVLIGASMGGTAALIAAGELFAGQLSPEELPSVKINVAGVVTLSAPLAFGGLDAGKSLPKIYCPQLFVAAEDDSAASDIPKLQELFGMIGNLEILPGSDHGTDLLSGSEADRVWGLLEDFLEKNLPLP